MQGSYLTPPKYKIPHQNITFCVSTQHEYRFENLTSHTSPKGAHLNLSQYFTRNQVGTKQEIQQDQGNHQVKDKIGIFHCMPVANRVTVKHARK